MDRAVIVEWLDDFGLAYEDYEVEDAHWAVVAHGNPFRVLVSEKRVTWPQLRMQLSITISPSHREILESVDEDTHDAFMLDLRMALVQRPVGYAIDEVEEVPVRVTLGTNLMEEPIARSGFMRRMHQLQSAGILVSLMFQKLERFGRWPA